MKIRAIFATTALVIGLAVAPASAQTAEQDMQQYMSSHPALQQNPSLMNNPNYLASHPDLSHFLQTHPQVDPADIWRHCLQPAQRNEWLKRTIWNVWAIQPATSMVAPSLSRSPVTDGAAGPAGVSQGTHPSGRRHWQ